MNIEKIHLQFVLHLKVWVFVICFLSVSACSVSAPRYSKQFKFDPGEKRLDIDVKKHCPYYVGVSFMSKAKDGDQAINKLFGTLGNINMPATVDIALLNEHGKRLFSRVDFGGVVSRYGYGPNPLRLIAGDVSLEPGKYTAMINIRGIDGDFSGFESAFFVTGDPKATCGKGNRRVVQEEHKKKVDKRYAEDSVCLREAFRESIYKRVVVKGMWPAEARLAGGLGVSRVKADPKKWKKGTHRTFVMKAQCTDPDDSIIEIDFQNAFQFSGGVVRQFTARFEKGVVTEIKEGWHSNYTEW